MLGIGMFAVRAIAVTLAAIACAQVAAAQSPGAARSATHDTIIGGQPAPPFQPCVEVEIGGDRAYGCLNQLLKREVDHVNPVTNTPPFGPRSADIQLGNVNVPAVRQQYGSNFERSVIPFRPPSVFLPPQR